MKYIGRSNFVDADNFSAQALEKMIDAAAARLPGTNEVPDEMIAELKWVSRNAAAKLLAKFE